jgi:hypothetical protein
MATVNPAGRDLRIIPGGDGQLFVLGDVSYEEAGAWSVQIVPDGLWVGNVVVLGRERGRGPNTDSVGFVPIPYRLISLNNLASDYRMVSDTISQNALIQIPAAGLSIGLLVACSAGQAVVYNHPCAGCAAP